MIQSAWLQNHTHKHYPHVKRELFSIRTGVGSGVGGLGDGKVCAVRSVSITYFSGGACSPAMCLGSGEWGPVGCSRAVLEGGIS